MSSDTLETDAPICGETVLSVAPVYGPIMRYGRLISARTRKGRVAFRYDQVDRAIAAILAHQNAFDTALIEFFEDNGWRVDASAPELDGLKKVRKLGAVVDFPEIKLMRGNTVVVVRSGATVCVDGRAALEDLDPSDFAGTRGDGVVFLSRRSNLRLYSKMWLRSVLVTYNGRACCDLDVGAYLTFAEEFERTSALALEALNAPYLSVLADLLDMDKNRINLRTKHQISNLTVNGEHDSLRWMYDQIEADAFVVTGCDTLKRTAYYDTFDAFFTFMMKQLEPEVVSIGCENLYTFDREFSKGVFAINVSDDMTRVYGIAHSPFWTAKDLKSGEKPSAWKQSPGNSLGAVAMTGVASKF
jgi:hypothetical protein